MLKSPAFIAACTLCAIAIVGLTRVYDAAPPQAIGLTVATGTLLILALVKFNTPFRDRFQSLSTEQLICWHSIRAPIGAAFLVLSDEGLLPELFAVRAGYGDLAVAILGVLAIAACARMNNRRQKAAVYLAWNLLGLADLLLALGTGIYLAFNAPDSMIWIARLPLLLVPAFILPVLFATHVIMLRRLVKTLRQSPRIAD